MNNQFDAFVQKIAYGFKYRLFLATKLPAAFFVGLRLVLLNEQQCVVKIKHTWFNKNPFNSMYFAAEAMAAEMASGLLAFGHSYKKRPAISMLVVKMEIDFIKKATGTILFTCEEGEAIKQVIDSCLQSNKGETITIKSIGTNENKEVVANFSITWSFKAKAIS